MQQKSQLGLILSIVFINVVIAYGLGALLTPYIQNLPNQTILITGSTALMLAVQLALSPAVGHWSDKAGRRPAVIAMTIVSLLSTVLLLPINPYVYFINRTAQGGTNGLYSVLRSAITDVTKNNQLVRNSGIISYLISGSAALGPLVPAFLLFASEEARDNPRFTVVLLLAGCILNVGLAFLLRETNDKPKEKVPFAELRQKAVNALKVTVLWQDLTKGDQKTPGLKPIFILSLLTTLSFGYYAYFVAFLTTSELKMTSLETARFFAYFGGLSLLTNLVFFRYIVDRVNKRRVFIGMVTLGIGTQIGFMFAQSSVTLLYAVATVDAIGVAVCIGLIGAVFSEVASQGSGQGEVFGSLQALGGLASFATALVNGLLSGISAIAPFIFCALSSVVVLWWTSRLPANARRYTDRIGTKQPQGVEHPEESV